MKKSIYIITNKLNGKSYIGQAVDVKKRFQSHCKPSAWILNGDLVGRAIQKYGKENFVCETLCENVDDYNEQEIYYIEKYNTIAPNGYNISSGGESPPVFSGCEHPEAVLTKEQINDLTNDLMNTSTPMSVLANKYGYTSSGMVSSFNSGKTYYRGFIDYPIRKDAHNGKLSSKDVDDIIHRLKNSYDSYDSIAKEYGMDYRAVARINNGVLHRRENESYPIRESKPKSSSTKLTYQQVTEIINLILNTNKSLREIGREYGVKYEDILFIKNGTTKMYRRKGLTYPLRKNN